MPGKKLSLTLSDEGCLVTTNYFHWSCTCIFDPCQHLDLNIKHLSEKRCEFVVITRTMHLETISTMNFKKKKCTKSLISKTYI